MSVVYNLFTNVGQNPWTKLDKTSYVHIMSTIMSNGGRKNLRDKTRTKPRHNLDIDIDIDNDIDNILFPKENNISGVMSRFCPSFVP